MTNPDDATPARPASDAPAPPRHICSKSGLPMGFWQIGPCPGCRAASPAQEATPPLSAGTLEPLEIDGPPFTDAQAAALGRRLAERRSGLPISEVDLDAPAAPTPEASAPGPLHDMRSHDVRYFVAALAEAAQILGNTNGLDTKLLASAHLLNHYAEQARASVAPEEYRS